MKKLLKRIKPKTLRSKSNLALVIIATVLVEVTSSVQYWYASEGIRKAVQYRAESELRAKSLEIRNVITGVESALNNTAWVLEKQLANPDSLSNISRKMVELNPAIVGCGIAFVPDYYKQKGHWFEPYVVQLPDGSIEVKQIGSAEHNYQEADWYSSCIQTGKELWSEPYFDDAGAKMMLCTYSMPLRDATGRIVAVVGADVSLDWLSQVINTQHIYPSSYNLVISKQGKLMACPVESLVMRRTIQEVTSDMKDTTVRDINRQMTTGHSGQATVTDDKGEKLYVFFAPIGQTGNADGADSKHGWSMAVVCNDREIYLGLRTVGFNLMLLILAGLILMIYIIYRTARSAANMESIRAEKERIAGELRIASDIQSSMLPKIFPPYPDRKDVDIHARLCPAKEVGGDLYDFYIRDEKLIFCIGDVSGKGVPASLVMAVTRSLFRTVSAHESHPARIISTLNASMAEMNDTNMFVTLFIGVLDLPTGRLRYCSAGHDAPLLLSNGEVKMLQQESNIPVGVMAGFTFEAQSITIGTGDILFLYTDGLTEAMDANRQQFGEERMMKIAQGKNTSNELIKAMEIALEKFVGNAEQSDDQTMLAILYTPQAQESRKLGVLKLTNNVDQVPTLNDFIEQMAIKAGFDESDAMSIKLAVEEATVNVMSYAYSEGVVGEVYIEADVNDESMIISITDWGTPFDPTAVPDADTTLSADERPIGGLGILLVRELMDSMNYERIEGKNVLTLRKKIMNN